MHDSRGMGRSQGLGDLTADLQYLIERSFLPSQRSERVLVNQLHDDIGLLPILANIVDRANVRMIQRRGHASLSLKSLQEVRILDAIRRQEFQGDLTAEPRILREEDLPHAAFAQSLENFIMREPPREVGSGRRTRNHGEIVIRSFSWVGANRLATGRATDRFGSNGRRRCPFDELVAMRT